MNQDFRDLLAEVNAHSVEYIVVGAHALAAHGHVRATKDLDVWIRPSSDNALRAYAALGKFGAPLHELTVEDLAVPGTVFQIGVAPIRIDIITAIDGVDFESAWDTRLSVPFADQVVHVLSRDDLIRNKQAAGREQDEVRARYLFLKACHVGFQLVPAPGLRVTGSVPRKAARGSGDKYLPATRAGPAARGGLRSCE